MKNKIKKWGIVSGVALTVVSTIVLPSTKAEASTSQQTSKEAMTYVGSLIGKGIDYDGYYGNQCVDLIKTYYDYLGEKAVLGNAIDYTTNALPEGWKRLEGVQPEAGDVLVYTGGPVGHVAIYASEKVTYHQNYGASVVKKIEGKRYDQLPGLTYWGVIRPNFVREDGYYAEDGFLYYYKDGQRLTGFSIVDGKEKFFKEGFLYTGWIDFEGKTYYIKEGEKYTGLKNMGKEEGETISHPSYFGKDGALRKGLVYFKSKKGVASHYLYFDEKGWLKTGWVDIPASKTEGAYRAYFDELGWLVTGKRRIDGVQYVFDDKGHVISNTPVASITAIPEDLKH